MGKINLQAENDGQRRILDYLEQNASDALTEKINNGTTTAAGVVVKKTMAGCWSYIRDQARKKAVNQCAVIEDAEVYGWAVHYFEEDDIPEKTAQNKAIPASAEERKRKYEEVLEKQAAEAEEKERKRAERAAEKEAEERKRIERAEEERRQKRLRAAERAEAAAAKAKEREEKATGAVAGQLSLFDLLEG